MEEEVDYNKLSQRELWDLIVRLKEFYCEREAKVAKTREMTRLNSLINRAEQAINRCERT